VAIVHQVGSKLREQIGNFSGELSKSLKKVSKRFCKEMIYGILSSGSVHLSKIARSLDEDISLDKTHERLCRNLKDSQFEETINAFVLNQASKHIKRDSLIVVDPTEIVKPFAKKMEYLAKVRDGSTKEIRNGYWLCQAIATTSGTNEIIPLSNRLYSSKAPDFDSENNIILNMVQDIYDSTGYNGIIVFDRGGDRGNLLEPWSKNHLVNFIIRQVGQRHLLKGKKLISTLEIAENCRLPFRETVTKQKDGKTEVVDIDFGYVPVKLPEYQERNLSLVVVRGFGIKPMMLLTTLPLKKSRKSIWFIVESYISRWRIEETIRFIKQSYEIEDIRLLTYRRLKNMMTFILAATYFICTHIGLSERMKILAAHAISAAKRLFGIPDFNYYCISDGLKSIFSRCPGGISKKRFKDPPDKNQLSLF